MIRKKIIITLSVIILSLCNRFSLQAMETQKYAQQESPIDERILKELYAWESPRLLHIKKVE